MDSHQDLPKFRHPPLVEVVHGVQFKRVPMTIVHPGLFFECIKDKFPKSQTVPTIPSLQPLFEPTLRQPPSALQLMEADELPRAWFIADDDIMLLQLQVDRLLLNWRKEPTYAVYPHFENVHERFNEAYAAFEQFLATEGLGSLEPELCELTYINHIPANRPDGGAKALRDVFLSWNDDIGPEWRQPVDGLNWSARYTLRYGEGTADARMTANLSQIGKPGVSKGEQPSEIPRYFQLDISVHGRPLGVGQEGVAAFHQRAHSDIVNYFKAVTSASAHLEWEIIS